VEARRSVDFRVSQALERAPVAGRAPAARRAHSMAPSGWGNDLVSTPAASRGGTAQTTPRASMPQSALKTRDKQMLPSVAAALRRDKQREGGISFREPNGSVFDPNRCAQCAAHAG